jgi:hypothetical protein
MSDYFAILASRIAGAPEALRPVLPSRFEPMETNFGNAGEGDEGDPRVVVLEVERDAPLPTPPLRQMPTRQLRPASRSRAKDEQFEKDALAPAQQRAPAVQLPPASSSPQPPGRRLPEPAITAPESHEQPSGPSEPVNAQRLSPVIAPAPPPRPPTVIRKPPSPTEPEPESSRRSISRPTLLPHEPDDPPLSQRKARLRDHRAEDAESSPARDRRPTLTALPTDQAPPRPGPPPIRGDLLHAAAAPATAALPAIQITIGRIEVEAVLPPLPATAPAVQRAAVPLLSLDEYLARRDGSGT